MNESKDVQPTVNQREVRQVDLHAELKKTLDEEFTSALELKDELTDVQRRMLHSLIAEGKVSATAILQTLRSTGNQVDE